MLLHGSCQKFFHTGELLEKGEVKYGLKDGQWRTWHPNGRLKRVETWRRGVLHGDQLQFNEKGEFLGSSRYVNGKEKRTNRREKKPERSDENEGANSGKILKDRKGSREAAKKERATVKDRKAGPGLAEPDPNVGSERERRRVSKRRSRDTETKE